MLTYGRQYIDQSDIDAVVDVLKSPWLTQGNTIADFERGLSTSLACEHACVVSNGTAALHLTALALGWQTGDVILTSPITFVASANAILYAGAIPDFVDINLFDNTIDIEKLEEKIKEHKRNGNKVKAIVAVDYAGHPCDWKALREVANRYHLDLVNDSCHALGATYDGRINYGTLYADAVTYSFHPVKHITCGEGGAVLTNRRDLFEKVAQLRNHGIIRGDQEQFSDSPWYYEVVSLGFNYRLTDIQSALGISQLSKLEEFLTKRRYVAEAYDKFFEDDSRFLIPPRRANIEHSYHLYSLQFEFNVGRYTRSQLFHEMGKKGIKLQVHYIPVYWHPIYVQKFSYPRGYCPNAEKFYSRQFSLPIHPGLTEDEVKYVSKTIKSFLAS